MVCFFDNKLSSNALRITKSHYISVKFENPRNGKYGGILLQMKVFKTLSRRSRKPATSKDGKSFKVVHTGPTEDTVMLTAVWNENREVLMWFLCYLHRPYWLTSFLCVKTPRRYLSNTCMDLSRSNGSSSQGFVRYTRGLRKKIGKAVAVQAWAF